MVSQNIGVQGGNIIESMNQAFDNGSFYGLEYVLDELIAETSVAKKDSTIDWFGFWDSFE